jgi:hypothetical protein
VGDYSPEVDKISRVARVKKKNPLYANAFANDAICDCMFLDSNISKLRISNCARELDQTNKFYNVCARAKLNEYFLPQRHLVRLVLKVPCLFDSFECILIELLCRPKLAPTVNALDFDDRWSTHAAHDLFVLAIYVRKEFQRDPDKAGRLCLMCYVTRHSSDNFSCLF